MREENDLSSSDVNSQQSGSAGTLPSDISDHSSAASGGGDEASGQAVLTPPNSNRFNQRLNLELANSQFIGEEEMQDNNQACQVLSPIAKNEVWSLDELLMQIEGLNADPDVRKAINIFRSERREIFGDDDVDKSTFRSCCQILIDEIDDVIEEKLGEDYSKYKKALSFYRECLADSDFESLPSDYDGCVAP